ncbi:hypothetical protein [Sphingobium yanoikuyae]|nr:hypothetical protein [Sphingobium yanoikuyae]
MTEAISVSGQQQTAAATIFSCAQLSVDANGHVAGLRLGNEGGAGVRFTFDPAMLRDVTVQAGSASTAAEHDLNAMSLDQLKAQQATAHCVLNNCEAAIVSAQNSKACAENHLALINHLITLKSKGE